MDDYILEEEEIFWSVGRLCLNRSGGPSGIREEHLRQWLIFGTRNDTPDASNFQKVVATMQTAFRNGELAEECTW